MSSVWPSPSSVETAVATVGQDPGAEGEAAGWWLGVVDDGPGLDPTVAQRLGERFAKGRGSRGAGLGLSIARSVVERHGGTLVAQPGEGGVGLRVGLCWGGKEAP